MMGPYQTYSDVSGEPMPQEVSRLHAANRVRSGDPDKLVRNVRLRHLAKACENAGVELGDLDRRTLAWLAELDNDAVQVVIGLISRAHAAGRGA